MRRAARFAQSCLLERWPHTQSVSIVCGSGNNAGDGYLLAIELKNRQIEVQVIQKGDSKRLSGDALIAYKSLIDNGIEVSTASELVGDVVVDALLGTGTQGAIKPAYEEAIKQINESHKPVLALDLPSGINADTGALLCEIPVKADLTTCFVGRKIGLLTGIARNFAGDIKSSTLDIPDRAFEQAGGMELLPRSLTESRLPERDPASHKRSFGSITVIAGNSGMGGAALLTAEACLRTGAGLVSVITHSHHAVQLLASRPELIVQPHNGDISEESIARAEVVALGPGLGQDEWSQGLFKSVLDQSPAALVLDADGLNLLQDSKTTLPANAILTPHPGEAARLLNSSTQDIEFDRLTAVKEISREYGATTLLKGAGTLVANQGDLVGVFDVSEPALSTAGSGDVLTGIVAACLAQVKDPVLATITGVHLHAEAGRLARQERGGGAVIASDVITALRPWG